ncbi:hypothetical protein KL936_002767 [Ogataea polymorpha]|nr:hypothetical protein KL936_002767 [Ogataea polymorpha]
MSSDFISNNDFCFTCKKAKFKYRCPKCGYRSCSLVCYKEHKNITGCSGNSDLTSNFVSYKTKDQLSSKDVQRDYNLLLRISRKVELGKQEARCSKLLNRNSKHLNDRKKRQRSLFRPFSYYANKSGVHIIELPEGMLRKRLNRSYYDAKRNLCCWTIEWVIINSRLDKIYSVLSHGNYEDDSLTKLLPNDIYVKLQEKFAAHTLPPGPTADIRSLTSRSDNGSLAPSLGEEREDIQEELRKLHIYYFLRSESTSDVFISLREDMSIRTTLKDQSVIEFPTIYLSMEPIIQDRIIVEQLIERDSDMNKVRISIGEATSSDDEPPEETSIKHQLGN